MFLPNKTIKSKNLIIRKKNVGQKKNTQKNIGLAGLHVVLKPCARPSKQPMVLLWGLANGFKTMCKGS